jgi:hypothetical protein
MSDAVNKFVAAMRADPRLGPDVADDIAHALAVVDRDAETSPDAAGLFEALHYVLAHPDHSVTEKLVKCDELINRRGRQSGRISELTGWR